jgi:hypothetical protein
LLKANFLEVKITRSMMEDFDEPMCALPSRMTLHLYKIYKKPLLTPRMILLSVAPSSMVCYHVDEFQLPV